MSSILALAFQRERVGENIQSHNNLKLSKPGKRNSPGSIENSKEETY